MNFAGYLISPFTELQLEYENLPLSWWSFASASEVSCAHFHLIRKDVSFGLPWQESA